MKKILIGLLLLGSLFAANSNQTITFQGKLLDSAGVVVKVPTNMTYTLYAQSSGGVPLANASWTKNSVPVINGIYVVELDVSSVTIPDDVWVQVNVGGTDLTPRIHLTSSVFAKRALLADMATNAINSDTLDGKHASDFASSTNASNATHTGDVTGATVLTIANGAVTSPKLASMGATSGQTLKWDGFAWAPATDIDTNTIYTAGSGLNLAGSVFSNTAPDQTVVLSSGTGISVSGTYPSFTVANTAANATHTGDVTGATVLTIGAGKVTSAMIATNVAITGTITTANTATLLTMTSGTSTLQIMPTANNSFDFIF